MITKERIGNELYVYYNGKLAYKRWYTRDGLSKKQPSLLFNAPTGWPNTWIA